MKKASAAEVIPTQPGTPAPGGLFVRKMLDDHGQPYALIAATIDGDFANVDHKTALKKAKAFRGGKFKDWSLPNRAEALALFEHLRDPLDGKPDAFERAWYWTSTPSAGDPASAWCQSFTSGLQYDTLTSDHCRARAVRRLVL